jgi:hypothetical protein
MCIVIRALISCTTSTYKCFAKPDCNSKVCNNVCRAMMAITGTALLVLLALMVYALMYMTYALIASAGL